MDLSELLLLLGGIGAVLLVLFRPKGKKLVVVPKPDTKKMVTEADAKAKRKYDAADKALKSENPFEATATLLRHELEKMELFGDGTKDSFK